jgi:hypothetical protein
MPSINGHTEVARVLQASGDLAGIIGTEAPFTQTVIDSLDEIANRTFCGDIPGMLNLHKDAIARKQTGHLLDKPRDVFDGHLLDAVLDSAPACCPRLT